MPVTRNLPAGRHRLPALPAMQLVPTTDPIAGGILARVQGGRFHMKPQPGFWLVRLGKGTPPSPACIRWCETTAEPDEPDNEMERSPFLAAFIHEMPVAMGRVWDWRGQPITEQEYRYRCALTDWAQKHAPDLPEAEPTKRVNLAQAAPIYRRKT